MQTLVRCGVSYKINSAFADSMQVPRVLQACQKTVLRSVISAQSQLKPHFSKPSSTAASTGGGPILHRAPLTSAGWCGLVLSNLRQILHPYTAVNIKNQAFDCGRAVIDSKQWKKKVVKK